MKIYEKCICNSFFYGYETCTIAKDLEMYLIFKGNAVGKLKLNVSTWSDTKNYTRELSLRNPDAKGNGQAKKSNAQ